MLSDGAIPACDTLLCSCLCVLQSDNLAALHSSAVEIQASLVSKAAAVSYASCQCFAVLSYL